MSLADCLSWQSPSASGLYVARFRGKAEARLSRALSIAQSAPNGGLALEVASALPDDALERIAFSPELEFRLRCCATDDDGPLALEAFLLDALQREVGGGQPVEPELAHGLRVDFDGPSHRADLPRRFPNYRNYASGDRAAILARLDSAIAFVDAGGPAVTRFTTALTQTIVPLAVDDAGEQFGSFSSSWYPGRTVLLNLHLPQMTVYETAAALVHEAIHSLVDVSELEGRMIAKPSVPPRPVTSPWTGATISLPSLIDAYFVWFGLLHFWMQIEEARAAPAAVSRHYIELSSRGFGPPLGDVIGAEAMADVDPFAVGEINALRERIYSVTTP